MSYLHIITKIERIRVFMNELFDVLNERAEFINIVESRDNCHQKGLWHKAVVVFILNNKGQVLLQKRSANKKMWPNMWDVSAGGHVLTGEFGFQAAIRESTEELGIKLLRSELDFIGLTISSSSYGDVKDNHFNEYYVAYKDIEISELTLQADEVSDVEWVEILDLIYKIRNSYQDLTPKKGCWDYLLRYFSLNDF